MANIATIRSMIYPKLRDQTIEPGFYELNVEVDMYEATMTGDPKGFVQHKLAQHLARCVHDTELPLGERCWEIHFTQFAQEHLGYPGGFVV